MHLALIRRLIATTSNFKLRETIVLDKFRDFLFFYKHIIIMRTGSFNENRINITFNLN